MMFPGLVSIPVDDERDEESSRSQYASKKDLKWLAVALVIFVIVFAPVYVYYKKQADWHTCAVNMNSIYKCLSAYAADHDDRFPPIAWQENTSTGAPVVEN